jgi:hypothetical protein
VEAVAQVGHVQGQGQPPRRPEAGHRPAQQRPEADRWVQFGAAAAGLAGGRLVELAQPLTQGVDRLAAQGGQG